MGGGDTDLFSLPMGFKQGFGCVVAKRREKTGLSHALGEHERRGSVWMSCSTPKGLGTPFLPMPSSEHPEEGLSDSEVTWH